MIEAYCTLSRRQKQLTKTLILWISAYESLNLIEERKILGELKNQNDGPPK